SIVTPGWPVVCGVGLGSCANDARTGPKKLAVIVRYRPVFRDFVIVIVGHSCSTPGECLANRDNKSSYRLTSFVLRIHRRGFTRFTCAKRNMVSMECLRYYDGLKDR